MKDNCEGEVKKELTQNFAELKQALQASETKFKAIFEKAAIGIVIVDKQSGLVLDANPALEKILGYTKEELKNILLIDITHPDDLGVTLNRFAELRNKAREYHQLEKRYIRKDGKLIWVNMTTSLVQDVDGEDGFIFGMIEDITRRKETENKLKWSESLLRLMAAASPQAFLIIDNKHDKILYYNERFCQIWRVEDLETPLKNGEIKYNEIISHMARQVGNTPGFIALAEILADLENRQVVEEEIELRDQRIIRHYSTQMRDDNDEYIGRLHIFEDITERKQLEYSLEQARLEAERAKEEAERLAYTDYLTGLYNRRAFISMLKMEVDRAKRKKEKLSLILLDVDNFKEINDTYGHLAGDKVLQEISQIISSNLRTYDFVGRYGGEEFIICLPDTSEGQALTIAERIRGLIADTTVIIPDLEKAIHITVSMGITSWAPEEDGELDMLIKKADAELYEAKKMGRNKVCLAK